MATGAEQVRWDLSDLFKSPDDPALEATLARALEQAKAFEAKYKGKVATLDPPEFAGARAYFVPAIESPLGFNRIVATNDGKAFVGTHSDAGVVRWEFDNGAVPSHILPPARFLTSPLRR